MAVATYDLIVSLADLGGQARPGVRVSVDTVGPGPGVAGSPSQTVLARPLVRYTDSGGQAVFGLLPSADAGDYRVRIFAAGEVTEKLIAMPARDARLSELGAALAGNLYWAQDANFAGAATSLTATITVPDFSGEETQYLAVPKSRAGTTWIGQAGTGYNQIGAWQEGSDASIGDEEVVVWQSVSPWDGAVVSGSVWEVR